MSSNVELPKPMSNEDYYDEVKKLSKLNKDDVNNICDSFTREIKFLINDIKNTLHPTNDEEELVEINRLQRIISFVPADEVFLRCKDKIWATKTQIVNKDASTFLNIDVSKNIKKDDKQNMIETLISIVKNKYKEMSEEERNEYWKRISKLLCIVCEFIKLTSVKK
jgi:hypothetical protein